MKKATFSVKYQITGFQEISCKVCKYAILDTAQYNAFTKQTFQLELGDC